jgi:glucose/mannose-6-phosphate isomerase
LDWTRRFLSRHSGTTLEYWTEGGSWLERLLMLLLLGDYASVYLGLLNGEDPSPVAAIDELKTELSGTPEAG